MTVIWLLTGCGLESGSITGSPLRFHAISSRWQTTGDLKQHLVTTLGGEDMLRRMGCTLDATRLPASLLLRHEPFKAFRLWSYLVTAVSAVLLPRRLPRGDVVITVSDYFCDIIPAMRMVRRPGVRWIAWIHHRERHPSERPGNRLINEITWRMQEWSFRRIARHATQAWIYDTAAGDEIAQHLQALGMPPQQIRKMVCGIDLETIQHVPESKKSVDAVMVGVRPNKGAYDIAPIWQEVQRLRPGTTLRLMGGMASRERVEGQIKQAGLENVITFFKPEGGWLQPEAHFAKLKEARLFFAPSHEEGWGIALCEAMACGLPVVAYDLPVYRRIYGEALLTLPENDHRAFAAAICDVLDKTERYALFQKRGHACAAAYDWAKVAREDRAAIQNQA